GGGGGGVQARARAPRRPRRRGSPLRAAAGAATGLRAAESGTRVCDRMISPESIRIAVGGIAANRLRSSLTVLGITVGVAAVIILVAVGRGSAVDVQKRIESLGTNTLTIFAGGGFGPGGGGGRVSRTGTQSRFGSLTTKDVKALQNKTLAPDLASVSPVANASVTATFAGATHHPSSFFGST